MSRKCTRSKLAPCVCDGYGFDCRDDISLLTNRRSKGKERIIFLVRE